MQCRGREGGEAGRGGRDVAEGERERERERVEGERAKKSAKTHCAAVRFCQSGPNLQHGRNGQKPGSKMCEQFSKNRCKNSRQRLAESRGNSQDQKTCSGQKLQKSSTRGGGERGRRTREGSRKERESRNKGRRVGRRGGEREESGREAERQREREKRDKETKRQTSPALQNNIAS